ncbi:MAG: hypothetical protein K0V04_07315 [Deltaproteobacteria bacterium]|nr:hypothetical protein [Deltaproteobacteria bacterium]
MSPRSSLCFAVISLALALPACASAPAPATTLPSLVASSAHAKAAPTADPYDGLALPLLDTCDAEPVTEDPRCPEDIVFSAILSHFDKTTAEFDGSELQQVEHDPELLWEEATADSEFRGLLIQADASGDGVLDRAEAQGLESTVLELWERRYMARND